MTDRLDHSEYIKEHMDVSDQFLPLGDSILASWIRSICQTSRGYGIDPEPIMKRCGLEAELLSVPDGRFPAMNVRRFWDALLSETGDSLFGIRCGQEMQAAALHGLGLAILTSRSLAQVLELMAMYCKVISSTMDANLKHDESGTTLALRTLHGTEANHSAILAILAFVFRQANSLSQHCVYPTKVWVNNAGFKAYEIERLKQHFKCEIDNAETNEWGIGFAYSDLIEPYASANAILREVNTRVTVQYLSRVRQNSFTSRVQEEMFQLITAGEAISIVDVATRLNLSARTLQRRLDHEGVTFSELIDKNKKAMAHNALAHTDRSVTDIAYTLGFSDLSNFSRTCTRWFGVSPTSYRQRIRKLQT